MEKIQNNTLSQKFHNFMSQELKVEDGKEKIITFFDSLFENNVEKFTHENIDSNTVKVSVTLKHSIQKNLQNSVLNISKQVDFIIDKDKDHYPVTFDRSSAPYEDQTIGYIWKSRNSWEFVNPGKENLGIFTSPSFGPLYPFLSIGSMGRRMTDPNTLEHVINQKTDPNPVPTDQV